MKKHKVLSVFIIIGVVILVLGVFTTIAGFAAGGRIDSGFNWSDYFSLPRRNWDGTGKTVRDTENIDYNIKATVNSINIDVAVGDIEIIPNAQNARVEVRDYPKGILSISEDSGTLTIRDMSGYNININRPALLKITIYLAGSDLNNVDIKVDAGNVNVGGIKADGITLELDAGDLTITDAVFGKLDCRLAFGKADILDTTVGTLYAKLDAGDFKFSGDITKEADIKNNFGNVKLDLKEAEDNYYFDCSVSFGDISVNNNSSSGIGKRNVTFGSSNAPVKIKIEVDAGDITVKTK